MRGVMGVRMDGWTWWTTVLIDELVSLSLSQLNQLALADTVRMKTQAQPKLLLLDSESSSVSIGLRCPPVAFICFKPNCSPGVEKNNQQILQPQRDLCVSQPSFTYRRQTWTYLKDNGCLTREQLQEEATL